MRVGILGPLEVTDGARPVEIRGIRLRGLLARLALDAGRFVGADELATSLWADDVPADVTNALQSLVSRLRRTLPEPAALESRPGGYRLDLARDCVDAVQFERLARDGRRLLSTGDPVGAADRLRQALALWRGPALVDVAEMPFAAGPAARLEELRISALEDRIEADLAAGRATGRVPDVVAELEGLSTAHPLREHLWVLRVSALRDAGRPAEALAAYEQARTALAEELGADPGPELRELHLSVLRGDGAVEPPPAPRRQAPLTSFVGRAADLERIAELLRTSRLVTLVGPGGAGKTRLAYYAAEQAAERFGPNVWTAELAPVNDPGDIGTALLAALTLREVKLLDPLRDTASREPMERVAEALADRSALLVLDNCEHLVDAAAAAAEQLLTRCPDLHVLATSREPLAVYGESLCPVGPLGLPASAAADPLGYPAVRLFADRAAAVLPGFTVDEGNVGAVVQICRRLDGLPLAIELAAARLRSLPVAEIEARLDDRFRLLTGGSRTAVPRHRTLRAVVEWSWDLLDDTERQLAERFSVLTAGGTPDSVGAVCADGSLDAPDVLDLLAALVDKSLLQPADGVDPRFRMLETLREYGSEQLAERGEIQDVRMAHALYFRDLAETADRYLRTADQMEWIGRLSDERDNVLAALRFAADVGDADTALRIGAAMGWFWFMQDSHAEAATWLKLVVDLPGDEPVAERAVCLAMYSVTAWASGLLDPSEAGSLAKRVQVAADRARGHEHRYATLAVLDPVMHMIADDHDGALAAVGAAMSTPDPWTRATLLMIRAQLQENSGDAAGSRATAEQALERYRDVGDRWGMATTTASLAIARVSDGDIDGAIELFSESRLWLHELRAVGDEAETLVRMASAHARAGRLAEAEALLDEAEVLAHRTGTAVILGFIEYNRGELARLRGDTGTARRLLAEAVDRLVGAPAGPPQMRVVMLVGLAHVEMDVGAVAAARERLVDTYELGASTRDMPIMAIVGIAVARAAWLDGDATAAARLLGATRSVRGGDDLTHDDLRTLTAALRGALGDGAFDAAYASGSGLGRDDALEAMRP